jgi:Family of unknown function (DUF5995)
MERSTGIGALLRRMEGLLEPLEASRDPEWVERWDVAFADLYLDAVEDAQAGRRPPEPWAVAFGAGHGADGRPCATCCWA